MNSFIVRILKKLDHDRLIRQSVMVSFFGYAHGAANAFFHVLMGRSLPKDQYGAMTVMFGIVLIIATPMLAVRNTLAHFTGYLHQSNRDAEIPRCVRVWVRSLLAGLLLTFVFVLIFQQQLSRFFHMETSTPLLITAIILIPTVLIPVYTGVLHGLQSYLLMCVSINLWGILRLAAGAAFIYVIGTRADTGLIAHAVALFVSLYIAIRAYKLLVPFSEIQAFTTEKTDRYFFLSLLALSSYSLLMNMDLIIVKHYFPDVDDYGDYIRASTIMRTMVFMAQPIAIVMFPKVIQRGGEQTGSAIIIFKAAGLTSLILVAGVSAMVIIPQLPLFVLYGKESVNPQVIQIMRIVSWPMAALGLSFVLMNFELAQGRFICLIPLTAGALLFLAVGALRHETLIDISVLFLFVGILTMAGLLMTVWRAFRRADARTEFGVQGSGKETKNKG